MSLKRQQPPSVLREKHQVEPAQRHNVLSTVSMTRISLRESRVVTKSGTIMSLPNQRITSPRKLTSYYTELVTELVCDLQQSPKLNTKILTVVSIIQPPIGDSRCLYPAPIQSLASSTILCTSCSAGVAWRPKVLSLRSFQIIQLTRKNNESKPLRDALG